MAQNNPARDRLRWPQGLSVGFCYPQEEAMLEVRVHGTSPGRDFSAWIQRGTQRHCQRRPRRQRKAHQRRSRVNDSDPSVPMCRYAFGAASTATFYSNWLSTTAPSTSSASHLALPPLYRATVKGWICWHDIHPTSADHWWVSLIETWRSGTFVSASNASRRWCWLVLMARRSCARSATSALWCRATSDYKPFVHTRASSCS